jgi:hypothetical protein
MTLFSDLKTSIASDLGDPDNETFTDTRVGDFAIAGMSEVGRILPRRFQEDITPVADTLTYDLLATDFPDGEPGIDVVLVEVWNTETTPARLQWVIPPRSRGPANHSQAGWFVWESTLYLPNYVEESVDPDIHLIRVWGYAPYVRPTAGGDTLSLSWEQEMAVRAYARVEALSALNNNRDLFTQWQTRAGNSDITPAGLLNQLSMAQAEWSRQSKRLVTLREGR